MKDNMLICQVNKPQHTGHVNLYMYFVYIYGITKTKKAYVYCRLHGLRYGTRSDCDSNQLTNAVSTQNI